MTREEKINTLKAIIQECEDYQWQRKITLYEIIKDLEQELILDKIRTEIESITPKAHIRTGKLSIDTELMIPLDRVLKVLDKCKAESEE